MSNLEYYHKLGKHRKEIEFIEKCLSNDYYKTEYVVGLSNVKTIPVEMAEKIAFAFKEIYTANKIGKALKKEVLKKIDDEDAEKVLSYFERPPRCYVKTEGDYLVLKGEYRETFRIPSEDLEKLLEKNVVIEEKLLQEPKPEKITLEKEIIKEEKPIKEIEIKKDAKEERQYKKEEQKRIKSEIREKDREERLYKKQEKEKIKEEQKKVKEEIKEKVKQENLYKKQEQKKLKEEIKEKAAEEKLYKKAEKEKIRKETLEQVYSSAKSAYDYVNKPVFTINFPDYKSAANSALKSIDEAVRPAYEKAYNLFNKKVILRNYHLVIVLPAFLAGMYALGSQKAVMKSVDYCIDSCVKSGSKAIKGVYKITSGEMNEIHSKTNR